MSIDRPVPVPRTAVPLGITDPVQSARAELKAALAALEEKANIPRRASEAVDQKIRDVRRSAQRNPGAATALVAGVAGLGGVARWGLGRADTPGLVTQRPGTRGGAGRFVVRVRLPRGGGRRRRGTHGSFVNNPSSRSWKYSGDTAIGPAYAWSNPAMA